MELGGGPRSLPGAGSTQAAPSRVGVRLSEGVGGKVQTGKTADGAGEGVSANGLISRLEARRAPGKSRPNSSSGRTSTPGFSVHILSPSTQGTTGRGRHRRWSRESRGTTKAPASSVTAGVSTPPPTVKRRRPRSSYLSPKGETAAAPQSFPLQPSGNSQHVSPRPLYTQTWELSNLFIFPTHLPGPARRRKPPERCKPWGAPRARPYLCHC